MTTAPKKKTAVPAKAPPAVSKTVVAPVKASAKVAVKPKAATPASTAKGDEVKVAAVKVDKAVKPKKPKLVRDSFTIPKDEYLVLDALKLRAAKLTRPVKKSELLRAGIKALAALGDGPFLAALAQVPAIKTGRPTLAPAAKA